MQTLRLIQHEAQTISVGRMDHQTLQKAFKYNNFFWKDMIVGDKLPQSILKFKVFTELLLSTSK